MSKSKVGIVLFAIFTTALVGANTNEDNKYKNTQGNSGGILPFLQFTNDGIKVNFGGYHAEAGLGGLLTGNRAGGGLHASAGTPTGAEAAAGLGGTLDNNGATGGGLHARAGLGNNGPAAAAGLEGVLDGNAPPGARAQGYKYAESTAGFVGQADNDRKNIQVIPKYGKANLPQKSIEASSASTSFSATIDTSVPGKSEINKRFEDNVALKERSSVATASARGETYSGADVGAKSASLDNNKDAAYPARRYYRKRLREVARKNGIYNIVPNAELQDAPVADGTGISGSASAQLENSGYAGASPARKPYKGSTLFDDIFNIPISALNAVNQLLRNNVG